MKIRGYDRMLLQYEIRCDLLVWQDGVLHGVEYSQVKICCHLLRGREERWSSSMWSRSIYLKRGSSSISGETGSLSINPNEARRFLRCKWSRKLSSDVIGPGKARNLSLVVISPMWFYARNGQSEVWVLQGEAWCSLDRGSFQEEVMSPWAVLTWWEDWFLPCQI